AERTYPYEWIVAAIRAAVENNRRSWRYIEAILRRWAVDGVPKPRSSSPTAPEIDPYLRGSYFEQNDSH
ncbi:MAG: hypothetical protein CUN49_17850, partial [Candidatus Thermofonsia Clade 1 bacterium]